MEKVESKKEGGGLLLRLKLVSILFTAIGQTMMKKL